MVAARPWVPFTEREYLALEAVADLRHEFINGEIIGMPGAEAEHGAITTNALVQMKRSFPVRTSILGSRQRVKVEATRSYFYPDLTVVCGELKVVDPAPSSVVNPSLVIEVTEPWTQIHDVAKWQELRHIPSLDDFLVVSSDQRRVLHYQRADFGWLFVERTSGSLTLTNGATLTLDALYEEAPF